jgi:hypothetical protein
MSYTITLQCGCVVYVACHPETHVAHTRVIESVGDRCDERRHERGVRVFPWELLRGRRGHSSVVSSLLERVDPGALRN